MAGWTQFGGALVKMAVGPSAKRRFPTPLTSHQRWMVSLAAILAERTPGHSHTLLYPLKRIDRSTSRARLSDSWDITSTETLLEILGFLASHGHRDQMAPRLGHPPLAWDIVRYADVVRYGLASEYIDEPTAWRLLREVVAPVARTYGSWKEYADDYMIGRRVWMHGLTGTEHEDWPVSQEDTARAVQRLVDPMNEKSPWRQVPWETIHQPDV
ncbi:DUF1266 domain-containing protein [Streptomyces sp. NA02950]|uniref:DUF1266 domain-containing protein n=1 Tax=Streptomyces sp. NA02950 TaxID=2742137 RepID=UPI0015912A23|nr:DUF1266 domain-containing protein [Streptomyces sp. NA02950]QKV91790.1 DUF1266 domain-containing protein [Streptomyces sp. NA02950]